jgi:hypothetical protein
MTLAEQKMANNRSIVRDAITRIETAQAKIGLEMPDKVSAHMDALKNYASARSNNHWRVFVAVIVIARWLKRNKNGA